MTHLTVTHLHISAALAGSQRRPVQSARLWGAAEALREDIGAVFSPVEHYVYGPYIAATRAKLDEAAWETTWGEGRAMTLEAAVKHAFSEEREILTTAPTPEDSSLSGLTGKLTGREQEVAMLIGRGLTPRQIAAELGISKRTVDKHTLTILKKLELRSQTQVAVWVAQQ
jgi:DNA-binding CsgD family transcriptional regulator